MMTRGTRRLVPRLGMNFKPAGASSSPRGFSLRSMRDHARTIWQAAVEAVRPADLLQHALVDPALGLGAALRHAKRLVVLGCGKAGTAMSAAFEAALADFSGTVIGVVNVPAETVRPLRWIRLHAARPAATNHPTAEGAEGSRQILELARSAAPGDVGVCLLSGGGSALLPAPAPGVTLADKRVVTRLLHECGATINEMNCVRKHLSAIKGGRLAQAFAGKALFSLIISDVIGDPLDVIASGPTAEDPTTFADALKILDRYDIRKLAPEAVVHQLEQGRAGNIPETLKALPHHIRNCVIGNNQRALKAAAAKASQLGYPVLSLGSFIEGDTRQVATVMAGLVRSIRADCLPVAPPVCILSGGETTVTLGAGHGMGGRNQEFVLAMLAKLGPAGMRDVVVLSGGTDGEDGPTDAAGAIVDPGTFARATDSDLDLTKFLDRHDAYAFFKATGDLLVTGLTETNVMDVRVILVK
jgi:glycerate 2-kinase